MVSIEMIEVRELAKHLAYAGAMARVQAPVRSLVSSQYDKQ